MFRKFTIILSLFISTYAGKFDSAVRAFENQPEYVLPVATLLGTFSTALWHHTSAIGRDFSASISIPLSMAIIHDKDRTYSSTFVDTALFNSSLPSDEIEVKAYTDYTAPTIFGRDDAPTLYRSVLGVDGSVVDSIPVLYSDGISDMAAFNWVPFPQFQVSFSAFYTDITLRYVGRPNHSLGIHFPGVELRHDLGSFLKKSPINITVFSNLSFPRLKWTPGEGIEGSISMDGLTNFSGMTFGKAIKGIDMLIEMGYEYSSLQTSGRLYIVSDDEWVETNLKLRGRNRFRAGFTIAFNPGSWYRGVVNGSAGVEHSFAFVPLAVRIGNRDKDNSKKKSNKGE